jgi:DNA-binding transcriptional regulator YdaS (Cro superfamily)
LFLPQTALYRILIPMTLAEYVKVHGKKVKRVLAKKAGVRWATVHDIAEGRTTPRPETAKKIEKATRGQVTAASLLGLSAA